MGFEQTAKSSQSQNNEPSPAQDNQNNKPPEARPAETLPKDIQDLTGQSEIDIDLANNAFSKPNIKIKKGTKIVWTNQDETVHDITIDDGSPNGVVGEKLAKGQTDTFTFDVVQSYDYHCSEHENIKGNVTVTE